MLRGQSVTLLTKSEVGKDAFNRPEYVWIPEEVEDVLIGEPTPEEALDALNLTGRKCEYTLAIPKKDTHTWEGQRVQFWGKTWEVIEIPTQGIESMIPLRWNKKVKVARYGGREGGTEL